MQRVWTCRCGWRSTAENVDNRRHRGEAPKACRRCQSTALTVSHEKHPKITIVCKNPECRQDFIGWPGAKYCAKCRPKFTGAKIWQGRRKWIWTPERDQILRDEYKSNATVFATRWGWPKWVITHRAQQLGLSRTKEKPWTKAEDVFLLEWVGVHTPNWMAKHLQRTVTAIIVRLKRLNVSRRIQEGLTMGQLEQALGVDHRAIAGWVQSGRLPAERVESKRTPQQGGLRYVFREPDIAKFLIENPLSFRLDRVDQTWFMALMRDALRADAAGPDVAREAAKPQAARNKRIANKPTAAADLMPLHRRRRRDAVPSQKERRSCNQGSARAAQAGQRPSSSLTASSCCSCRLVRKQEAS